MPFDLKAMIADDPPKKRKCAHTKKLPSSKRQQTLEPQCNKTKMFFRARQQCIKTVLDDTHFAKLTVDQEYQDLIEINQERVFLKLSKKDKATFFQQESVDSFRKLANHFLMKANFCLQAQFDDGTFKLEDEFKEQDLEAIIAAQFEKLVEHGVVDEDEDEKDKLWRCPELHDVEYKRCCDWENVNSETLEGPKCNAWLCNKCDPQKQAFDLCPKHNKPKEIEKMTKIFEDREKYARRLAKIDERKAMRVVLVEEYKNKPQDAWYEHVNKKDLFLKLGIDPDTKRPYTAAEAREAAVCYGPAHDTKTKMKHGPLPVKPVPTIKYNSKVMNGIDVTKATDDILKNVKLEINLDSPDLDKVEAMLDSAQELITAGRNIIQKPDFDRFNKSLKENGASVYAIRFPPEPGAVDEPEPKYGSGCEDDEEDDDGHEVYDLEKLEKQDELDLLKLIESSDDE